jgi:hypothetical protein
MALLAGARLAKAALARQAAAASATATPIEVCTDSKTALAWSLALDAKLRADMDVRKVAYIDELIALRAELGARVVFCKISGDDNLADLGFHC